MFKKILKYATIIVGVSVVGLFTARKFIFYVDKGQRALVYDNFTGVKQEVYGEGFHYKSLSTGGVIVFDVNPKINMSSVKAITKDKEPVEVNVKFDYRPEIENLAKLFMMIGPKYDVILFPSITNEIVKQVILQHYLSDLNSVETEISELLTKKIRDYNVIAENVEIKVVG